MRVRTFTTVGLALTLLLGVSLFGPTADAGVLTLAEPQVVLFYDDEYVDTATDGGGEAFNLGETLDSFGISPVLVEDLATADFADVLQGVDVFIIPEVNGQNLLDAMTATQLADIRAFIADGGRVETFGSGNPFPLVNALIDSSFVYYDGEESSCGVDFEQGEPYLCSATATQANSEFAGGPSLLGYNNDTYGSPLAVEPDTKVIYEDDVTGGAAVFVQPFGHGSVMFYAWDWYFDDDPEDGPIDEGWFTVLALSLGIDTSVNDATATEGETATFTISVPLPPTQDVVVDYVTTDGTAVAGTDYVAQAGTAIIAAGTTSVTVGVPTLVVPGTQGARQFTLEISTPAWGVTLDGEGLGTINDPVTTTTAAPLQTVTPRFTG